MPFAPIKTKPAAESSMSSASTVLALVRVKLFEETIDKKDIDADDAVPRDWSPTPNEVAEPEVDAIAGSSVENPVAMELDAMPTSDYPVVMDVVEVIDRMSIVVALGKRKRQLEDAFVTSSPVRTLKRRKLCQHPVPVVDSVNMELDEEKASLHDPVDMGVDVMPSFDDVIDTAVDAMACLNKVAEPEVDAIAGSSVEIPVDMGLSAMPSFDGAIDTEVDAIPMDMGLGAMPSSDVAIDTEVDAMASSNKVAEPEVDAIAGSSVEIPVDMWLGAMPSFDYAIDTEADAMASSMKEAEPEVDAIVGSSVEIPVGMESVAMPTLDDPVDMKEDAMPSWDHAMSKKKKSSVSCLRARPYLERKCKVAVCLRMRPYLPRQCKKNVRVLVVQ
ncbi:hypothetical protein FisN_4Hu525 [Fistulifera solaris]|uniref:Uncharacterized protein n=1 Tax=Fistulifera solaris TaxID=1519565 RepID=A0A1Z5KI48_FISSO|nr:hypothetical protein FisN_4Hu525 [Fistulifera solaris]|eukprot:GAX25990.1 hypothetical protein FisN_4Hu525 [Fistulifera solaris]